MESTSVYWIPVYETLERAGFAVMLVPPRMTKQIGGRKSDVLDCQRSWQLMSYGLPPRDAVCPRRSYAGQMKRLTEDRSRCVLHIQKATSRKGFRSGQADDRRSAAVAPTPSNRAGDGV